MRKPSCASSSKRSAVPITVRIGLLPHQKAFFDSRAKEVLFSGAFGAGKTRALCYKVLQHAVHPGNFVGLCRKTYADLRASTLATLLESEPPLEPVLPPGTYLHRRQDRTISLRGGGAIYYFGFDRHQKLGSLNFGAVGIDEGIELEEEEYVMLLGRLRRKADPHRQIFTATNPAGPTHFLYRRFFEHDRPDRAVVQASSYANTFLPADYLRSLDTLEAQSRQRYVLGQWLAFEGLVYPAFSRAVHVRADCPFEPRELVIGVDYGFSTPSAVLAVLVGPDRAVHVGREVYRPRLLHDEVAARVGALVQHFGASPLRAVVVDPAEPALIERLRRTGLPARGGKNELDAGLAEIRRLLQPVARRPGCDTAYLTVGSGCVNTIREFESYVLDPATDRPRKENDHALDALRYAVQDLAAASPAVIVL